MRRFAAILPALALLAGCSLLLDLDELEGHPCSSTGECLEGYLCREGVCVLPDEGEVDACANQCSAAERCDEVTATCIPFCQGVVCGTGQACVPSVGGCTQVTDELGKSCVADADCADLVPGCSTDPANPGEVVCTCMVPATSTDGTGVCLALPTDPSDCSVCGSARCVRLPFSSADRAPATTGLAATRTLCAYEGFAGCEGQGDCEGSQEPTVCSYLSWPADPGLASGRVPWGFVAACATPTPGAGVRIGAGCDPTAPATCETGLCLPMGGGTSACTVPCRSQSGCAPLDAAAGGTAACVRAPLGLAVQAGGTFDVAQVCGTGPSLGLVCGGAAECRTDAPECSESECTRSCLNDGDCDPTQGVTCQGGFCR